MSVVSFGELLIDFVALEHGVSVGEASGFKKAPGGAPANVAVAVRRLGHKAAFLGQVGDDPFGWHLTEVLQAEGIDVSGLRHSTEARTMLAFVSLTKEGERSFVFYRHPSADMLMRPEDVALEVLQGYKIFHFGSITLITEPSRSALLMTARAAASQQMLISYDPNLRLSLWPSAEAARQEMWTGFNYAHIVKISEEEVEFLTGGHDIAPLWREQTQIIAVTRGAKGATVHSRKESIDVPGFAVNTLDTTGAGDAFMAGMLVGVLENPDNYLLKLREITRFANAVGAMATMNLGAIPSLPTREAADHFLKTPR